MDKVYQMDFNSSVLIFPSRMTATRPCTTRMIVDGSERFNVPPFKNISGYARLPSTRPSCRLTEAIVKHPGLPDMLAEVEVMGAPAQMAKRAAMVFADQRTAT